MSEETNNVSEPEAPETAPVSDSAAPVQSPLKAF